MSKRYIDADALKGMIEAKADTLIEGKQAFLYVAKWLDFLPPVDVAEVRHGEWETIPDYSHALTTYRHICSECKTVYKDVRPHGHNYCHICGAKMSGERSENGKS